ncbi:class I SAM-dependent methyltransferase [Kallotenue papyrolyticum]|uniref:class I SAM-dependent methyltransferase n=1 Tax=Kallotenue papyrolyticum TaxID=1325125 RepID=UPI0004785E52|nr:class I SAM-dependent methyltransferase [Kallotenue papyrolyticum]
MSVLPLPEQKPVYVHTMFAAIAARYDLMNRLMTFGLDQGWRRYAVRYVAGARAGGPRRALDLATGTGDFLPLLHQAMPDALVIGADFCLPMMQAGLSKLNATAGRGGFTAGDALRLPFADNSFDAITVGFGLRNVADLMAALREMHRVAKPGGRMACLEVARPASRLLRVGHHLYFTRVVPLLGALIGGNREAYTYLPQSAEVFPPPEHLRDLLRAAGWRHVHYRLLGGGAVAVHMAEK